MTTQQRLMRELGVAIEECGPKPQIASSKKVPPAVAPKPSRDITKADPMAYHKTTVSSGHNDFPPPPSQNYVHEHNSSQSNYSNSYQNASDFPPPPPSAYNVPPKKDELVYENFSQDYPPPSSVYNSSQQRPVPQPVSMSYKTTPNRPTYTYGSQQTSAHPTAGPQAPGSQSANQYSYGGREPAKSSNQPSYNSGAKMNYATSPTHQNGHSAKQVATPGGTKSVTEAEVDALTNLLLQNMEASSEPDFFGMCSKCHGAVIGEKSGCTAMDRIYHLECFVCSVCHRQLKGLPFFAMEGNPYCESCYMNTLEKCSVCAKAITDRILRATGKPYHPECFTCVVCKKSLDGIPFTVDAANLIHCIEDFHKKFAPRCCVCHLPIMPDEGQEETVRVVAMDRSFHVHCYKCEDCGKVLSSESEGRGCYPLDDHILCKSCNSKRIQTMTQQMTTEL